MDSDSSEVACWICLSSDGELEHVCACPQNRMVHRQCLARWNLQSAGRSEEYHCRFCQAPYPSWKESLTPRNLQPAIPTVSVHYAGLHYRLKVKPGSEGLASFQRQLRCITGLPELDCVQIMFQCRAPQSAEELSFKGMSAFDAAMHCASISAAKRQFADGTANAPPSSTSDAHVSTPIDSHLSGARARSLPPATDSSEQEVGHNFGTSHSGAAGQMEPISEQPPLVTPGVEGVCEQPGPLKSRLKRVQEDDLNWTVTDNIGPLQPGRE